MSGPKRPRNDGLDRRTFISGTLASSVLAGVPLLRTSAQEAVSAPAYPGLIVRQTEPDNLEFPFANLRDFITPTEQFYVRNHFAVPEYLPRDWRLRVEGAVERPLVLSLEDLRRMPARTGTALLECAGNGRIYLVPRAPGLLWEQGAVGNAEWTGVPLAAILEQAGVREGAVEVVLEGADSGTINDEPRTPGRIAYARSLPLAVARRPEVLLAYRMNGQDLTPRHGQPLRAVVPGWYGMASVKWLAKIIVTERPFEGYFQTFQYGYFERRHGQPSLVPVTELNVKAAIARPARHEVVRAGTTFRVFGAAWSGRADVTRVEISTDAGRTWSDARLLEQPVRDAWRLWEFAWRVPMQPGRATLIARATDSRQRTQPALHDPDRRNTMISHVVPAEVEIR